MQFPDAGVWMASAGTDPVNIDTVIELLQRELRRLADEPLNDDELANEPAPTTAEELVARFNRDRR